MASYVDYWKCILEEPKKTIPSQPATLIEGFWPTRDWRRYHVVVGIDTAVGEKEVDYCGPTKDKLNLMFNSWRDILVSNFVLVRPNNKENPIWLAKI